MVSVIIPVYNIKSYLPFCIDSIIAQNYENWELILIDDGSNDGSRGICDEYSLKDSRIKVSHTDNRGVGAARNFGIDKAKGDWIVFVDGDDYVSTDFLESMVKNAEIHNSDLTITKYSIYLKGEKGIIEHFPIPGFFKCHDIGKGFLIQTHPLLYSSCYRLFKTSIIKDNNLQFPNELSLGEDYVFSIQYISHINSVSFINQGEYKYIKRDGSLSHKKRLFSESFKVHQTIQDVYYSNIKNKYSKEMELFIGREVVDSLEVALLCLEDFKTKEKQINLLKNLDLRCYRKYKKCHNWKEWIIKQCLVLKLPRLYLFLRHYSFSKSL